MHDSVSQATTVPTTSNRPSQHAPVASIEVPGQSLRVDARSVRNRGPRAQVLKAYAEWLKQSPTRITEPALRPDNATTTDLHTTETGSFVRATDDAEPSPHSQTPPPSPPSPNLSADDQAQIDQLFHRIDAAIESSMNRPAVQLTAPHFETRNYVPPEPTTSDVAKPQSPWSERDQNLADKNRPPASGIVEHVRELQSKGRMIGELSIARQLDQARVVRRTVHDKPLPSPTANAPQTLHANVAAETAPTDVACCPWPEVTDLLLTRHRNAIDALGQRIDGVLAPEQCRIAVTCTRRREGASTIAMSLARWYAEHQMPVLLVDADLTHPDLIARLTPECERSWTKSLDDPQTLREQITKTISPHVDLLPLFRLGDNTRWKRPILGHLGDALRSLESDYERVIINTGPVYQLITEIGAASGLADTFVLVTAVNRTTDVEREQSQNGLLSVGAEKILVAQNFTRS